MRTKTKWIVDEVSVRKLHAVTGVGATTGGDEARPYGLFGLTVSLVVILFATLLLCALVGAAVFTLIGLTLGWNAAVHHLTDLQIQAGSDAMSLQRAGIVVSLFAYVALSLVILGTARLRGGSRWRSLVAWHGWHPFRRSRLFWILAAATLVYSFGADALLSHFYPPSSAWVTPPSGALWILLFVILAVALAPLAEELLFRGWLYTGLRAKIGAWAAIILSTALFALAHWESTHLYALAVFPVGLALGFIRERTGSLLASMAFHAIYNGTACVMLVVGN